MDFLSFHKSGKSLASMSLIEQSNLQYYGNVNMKENKIMNFSEKENSKEGLVNSGVYLFEKEIFDYIDSGKNVSLEKEVFPELAKEGKLNGYIYEDYFMDIGRPETYRQFRKDILETLIVKEEINIRGAMKKITENNTDLILIVDENKKLLGVLNDKLIKNYLLGGGNVEDDVSKALVIPSKIGKVEDTEDEIYKLLLSTYHLPIIDKKGIIKDVKFRVEEIKSEPFPTITGKAPLRISFAGGGTDVPRFFEKYGGVVINSTIDKYCHATIIKRADSKIVINSDMKKETILNPKNMEYDGNFDIVKAIVNIVKPDFGFDLHMYNDIPPGRGLGSSASISVLLTKLLGQLKGIEYNDEEIARMAYKAECEELKIKGGWQDQYAAVTGGFSFMEFNKDKTIVYPLRLKEDVIDELNSHLLLCYVGESHLSGDIHKSQEKSFLERENEVVKRLNNLKGIVEEIKDSLLTNNLSQIGRLLHYSWENKRKLSKSISNPKIDHLYDVGIKNGANGGKLLGAGGGGYILFSHFPTKRNKLVKILEDNGGKVMNFNFESNGAKVWYSQDSR